MRRGVHGAWIACRHCRLWETADKARDQAEGGVCRRHAPLPRLEHVDETPMLPVGFIVWPLTRPHEGCGEGLSA